MQQQAFQNARLARDRRFDGRFFVAVKTTGIFCRPICPAPAPKESNVEYFDLAHQAVQAGYRPCIRCRPDSAPSSYAWKGVDTTLERAIRLLKANPHQDIATIAQRLGITDRYCRQLFNQRLGVSPKQFQLAEQLLFAKQLLQQSPLPVEQVAQACGFQSARRLQDNMRRHFNLTPKQLRRADIDLPSTLTLSLSYRPPYDWLGVRRFLALRAVEGMETVTEHSYSRTINLFSENGQVVVTGDIHATHVPDAHRFDVQLRLSDIGYVKPVVEQLRRCLDLDADPASIARGLSDAGIDVGQQTPGLRLPGVWHPFEAGVRAVLGQQVSVTAAIGLVTRVVDELGQCHSSGRFFPTPEAVANSELSFLRMPGARRQALRTLATFFVDAPQAALQPENWLALKGIGPWTVAYAKLRGCSEPDIFLEGDLVIRKQRQSVSLRPEMATPWRSYLTFQLWAFA
ncbi:helix-turn-helix domain-containing protein [Aestuariibacter halophilus]|uniref:Helix-turn-helix domain-containing protein n=1 Tax=Fluctibacter halophilus TaxID=226011 RepID=A0ABS8GAM0_9ALTE|nr:AlkA N-terminal domain-containing protein [Aestuariibacter halophilus]MCC2617121.1 helix-turn-helix domain-containing protein [Aestuariibacter halophilus]